MGRTSPVIHQIGNGSNNEVTQGQKEIKFRPFHEMFCRACNFEQFVFSNFDGREARRKKIGMRIREPKVKLVWAKNENQTYLLKFIHRTII